VQLLVDVVAMMKKFEIEEEEEEERAINIGPIFSKGPKLFGSLCVLNNCEGVSRPRGIIFGVLSIMDTILFRKLIVVSINQPSHRFEILYIMRFSRPRPSMKTRSTVSQTSSG